MTEEGTLAVQVVESEVEGVVEVWWNNALKEYVISFDACNLFVVREIFWQN